jgi:hypothetical protein
MLRTFINSRKACYNVCMRLTKNLKGVHHLGFIALKKKFSEKLPAREGGGLSCVVPLTPLSASTYRYAKC